MELPRPFICSCGRGFTRNENLKRHQKSHHSSATARRFECSKCHNKYARRDVCKRHEVKCSYPEAAPSQSPLSVANEELNPLEPDISQALVPSPLRHPGLSQHEFDLTDIGALEQERRSNQEQLSSPSRRNDRVYPSPQSTNYGELLIELYFKNFHPSLPIIHKSTFTIESTSPILLEAMKAIGAQYLGGRARNTRQERHELSGQGMWASAVAQLEQLVHEHEQNFKILWVQQCWTLCIIYGTFTGNEEHIAKARNMYRNSVDIARDGQLLHQRLIISDDLLWSADLDLSNAPGEQLLTQKWQVYIYQESLKLSIYAFYLMDFYIFATSNLRPNLSATEFEWDLPWAAELWHAENANDWWSSVSQHGRDIFRLTSYIWGDVSYREHDHQSKSILAATQAILSDVPSNRLMSILKSSPFATLCVVANLDCLVRDFSRCYYQLPPNLTDPSSFHILSQRQNSQVFTALANIWRIMGDGPCAQCDDDCKSLWHAVRISCLSVKVSLSNPDDLLIGGIVESNPTASLVTAAHMTLGNYVIPRRSRLPLQKTSVGEEGLVALLDDLLKTMYEMSVPKSIVWEGPWTFIQGFRLLLVLWKILRLSVAEIENEPETSSSSYPKLSRHGRRVVDAVTSAIQMFQVETNEATRAHHELNEDRETEAETEVDYMQWMYTVCSKRTAWDGGQAMSEVLDEITAMTADGTSLRH